MERLNCNIITPATHDEWLAERAKGIGSSDAGTIMGVNPYQTMYQLWRKRKGMDEPQAETADMRRGHICEDSVAQWFAGETGYKILDWSKPDIILEDKERNYLRVSPDRIFEYEDGTLGILECKTTKSRNYSPEIYPESWFCQVQYQLGVAGLKQGAIACMNANFEFWTVPIYFDEVFYKTMVETIDNAWKLYFEGDAQPELTTAGDVETCFQCSEMGKTVTAGAGTIEKIEKRNRLRKQIEELEEARAIIENELKVEMGDAEFLVDKTGERLISFKSNKSSLSFDAKKFKDADPDAYATYFEKYQVEKRGTRPFKVLYDGLGTLETTVADAPTARRDAQSTVMTLSESDLFNF